jgi:hypothetical protein
MNPKAILNLASVTLLLTMLLMSFDFAEKPIHQSMNIDKEAKARWRLYKKMGWHPDSLFGDALCQFRKIIEFEQATDAEGNLKYIVSSQCGAGADLQTSANRALLNAQIQLAVELRDSFYDRLETDFGFRDKFRDIEPELWESREVFRYVFEQELFKSTLISRFYKYEHGIYNCAVTIVIDLEEFFSAFENLSREEMQEGLDEMPQDMMDAETDEPKYPAVRFLNDDTAIKLIRKNFEMFCRDLFVKSEEAASGGYIIVVNNNGEEIRIDPDFLPYLIPEKMCFWAFP